MNRDLTDTWLQNYKPKSARDEIFDERVKGFGVRVTTTCKSFFYFRRVKGERTRFSLGKYPQVTLSEARKKALDILVKIEGGGDPREAYRVRIPAVAQAGGETFGNVAKRFIADYCEGKKKPLRPRTVIGYKWALQGGPTAKWAKLPLAHVTDKEVIRAIDKLEADKHFASARLLRAYLSKFFNWAVGKRLVRENPTRGLELGSKPEDFKRKRRLSVSDLKDVLVAAEKLPGIFRDYIWTVIATGQRRGEVALMKWSDLTLDGYQPTWTIPPQNTKNGQGNVVPLAHEVILVLQALPRIGDYVFTTNGRTPIAGFSKIKLALDKHMAAAKPDQKLEHWRLHDLRRSFATGLGDHLGIAPHVIEAILNHISGEKEGVSGLYNRSLYESECRRALEAWAQLLTSPQPSSNIVSLRA